MFKTGITISLLVATLTSCVQFLPFPTDTSQASFELDAGSWYDNDTYHICYAFAELDRVDKELVVRAVRGALLAVEYDPIEINYSEGKVEASRNSGRWVGSPLLATSFVEMKPEGIYVSTYVNGVKHDFTSHPLDHPERTAKAVMLGTKSFVNAELAARSQ